MTPLLSIIIPTHNRAKYAIHSIRSILAIAEPALEVVVSDTSDQDDLATLIFSQPDFLINDIRLKYLRPKEKLDMTGNHNHAIGAATGEFVCLIGDDDTITVDAIMAARWAKERMIDIIAPNIVSNYAWPDFQSKFFGFKHAKRLYLPKKVGNIKNNDCELAFESALSKAAQGTEGLPKIYHGIVKRSILQKIFAVSGNYFHGSSPDVSGAIGLALCANTFVTVDFPLTIPGASGGSNTGRSALNKHKGKLSGESQTKSFEKHGWTDGVPKFFSVETVWAHAALETIARISPSKMRSFNYIRLLAICTVLHPEYQREICEAKASVERIMGISSFDITYRILWECLKYRFERMQYLSKRLLHPSASGGRLFIDGIETVEAAPPILQRHMDENKWNWSIVVNKF